MHGDVPPQYARSVHQCAANGCTPNCTHRVMSPCKACLRKQYDAHCPLVRGEEAGSRECHGSMHASRIGRRGRHAGQHACRKKLHGTHEPFVRCTSLLTRTWRSSSLVSMIARGKCQCVIGASCSRACRNVHRAAPPLPNSHPGFVTHVFISGVCQGLRYDFLWFHFATFGFCPGSCIPVPRPVPEFTKGYFAERIASTRTQPTCATLNA